MDQLCLPTSQVHKCIKNALPKKFQVNKEVKSLMQVSTGIFIMYLTHHITQSIGKRQTINKDDVLQAVKDLGFEFYKELEEV